MTQPDTGKTSHLRDAGAWRRDGLPPV